MAKLERQKRNADAQTASARFGKNSKKTGESE
jgi:hypothetical protein